MMANGMTMNVLDLQKMRGSAPATETVKDTRSFPRKRDPERQNGA